MKQKEILLPELLQKQIPVSRDFKHYRKVWMKVQVEENTKINDNNE